MDRLISEKAVLETIDTWVKTSEPYDRNGWLTPRYLYDRIKAISSAESKTGRWIAQDIYNCHTYFKCSECGYIHNFTHLYGKPTADYTYCPYCGAKMVEPQESEDKE